MTKAELLYDCEVDETTYHPLESQILSMGKVMARQLQGNCHLPRRL